ncbi:cell division protein SepF [Candidatus Bathyarchaeota archaeon]|nr:cell division protein SepF [Candidatus Bathyarchaeota archaeon]NIU81740.1 cell division protein SepF [Candidatus Bathyarchaeota archaeon]NIV68376.1 cell division protein SepF [Candidatus Bathyarchaeota archaeon]NIW16692.1 cell division protein SepF [Candidatus Bathyarchaeota archaeon]NIW34901.1 cell division protein SepF [Candidatus Bathyarchaeota archaeon]
MRALLLRNLDDVQTIKREVKSGNILILRIGALARKSVEDVKRAVDELCKFAESTGGDIARLGEERVVITPPSIHIWRGRDTTQKESTTEA